MDRKRMLTGLAIATFLGFILTVFVVHEFRVATAPEPVVVMKQMVVAAGPLPLGTRLTEKDLRVIPWPSNAPVANMFANPADCLNRALITSVAENEPILETKLAPIAAGAGLAATIPEGMRALSAAVNDVVAVAGFRHTRSHGGCARYGIDERKRKHYQDHSGKCSGAGGQPENRESQREAGKCCRHYPAGHARGCRKADHGQQCRKNSTGPAKHD